KRRLDGLEEELRLRREALTDDEEETRGKAIESQLADLTYLRGFALPLIERLDALQRQAPWGDWLTHLRALASAALREPDGVLATLAEIEPMAPIGPIDLDEVQLVLGPRLRELTVPPARRRYGAVFVAPARRRAASPSTSSSSPASPRSSSRGRSSRIRSSSTGTAALSTSPRSPRSPPGSARSDSHSGSPWARPASASSSRGRASTSSRHGRGCRRSTGSRRCVRRPDGCPASMSS